MRSHALWSRPGSFTLFAALLVLLVGVCSQVHAAATTARRTTQDTIIPNHYIVVFNDSVDHPGDLARAQTSSNGGSLGFVYSHALKGYSAVLSTQAVEALRRDPRVKYVTPDRVSSIAVQSTPTGIKRVFAVANKKLGINEKKDGAINADIAILDTGIDPTHADLNVFERTNCVPAGENTETEGTIKKCVGGGEDLNSHGTHVAGTAAAIDNESGVVGVAPEARLWAVRVLNKAGFGTQSWITAGVEWVTERAEQIEVANMSIECKCSQPALEEAIKNSVSKGVVYVVAAGNQASNAEEFSPAKNSDAITVGAIADYDGEPSAKSKTPPCSLTTYEKTWGAEKDDTFANFSNWGSVVDIVAPGVCILSTVPGSKYEIEGWWGTSMAAPHVAGAAAILAALSNPNNKADVEKIRETILAQGNKNWTAEHEGEQQPLLDVSNETVFKR
jgi:subtilisin